MAEYTVAIKVTGDVTRAQKSLGSLKGVVGGLGQSLQSLGTIALGGLGALTGAAGAAGAALTKLALDAAPLEGIEAAFQGITEASGVMGDEMLAALEKGSAGMVAQRDLMKSYNLAAQLVGDTFANQLPQAMEYLTKVSAATGEDMGYMMDSLVRGVGRLSPMILDNLGIQVDLTEAYEDWAKEAGKAVATTVDNSEAIGKLTQSLGFLERELAGAEQAYHDANAEFIHAQTIWPQGSVELNKFQRRVEKASLALDKKKAKLAEQRGALSKLQTEHGKTVSSTDKLVESMTKAEQQEALMAHVMKQLAANTEAMPDVTDNAATSIAALQAKFQNAKDAIGKAFLPVVVAVVGKLSDLADKVMPVIVDFIGSSVVPAIDKFFWALDALFGAVAGGEVCLSSLDDILLEFLPAEVVDRVRAFIAGVQNLAETVRPIATEIWNAITQFVNWKDVLIAVGICIASVILPIVVSLIAGVAPLVATMAGLIAVVALLRNAWENDWHGIRTALTEFWENTGRPALEQLWQWLQVSIPIAIQSLSDFWNNTLLPALQTVWTFIQESVLPVLADLWAWLQENIPIAIETLAMFWNETLLPALETIWAFMEEYVIPVMAAAANVMDAVLGLATTVLAGLWENVLWPALQKVWAFIQDNVIPIFEALTKKTEQRVGPKLKWLRDKVLEPLLKTFEKIKEIIKKVIKFLEDLADAIRNVKLPSWAEPGSPSPLEMAFRGIAEAVSESTAALAGYGRQMEGLGRLTNLGYGGIGLAGPAMAAAGATSNVMNSTVYNISQSIHTRATTGTVSQEFEVLRALYG